MKNEILENINLGNYTIGKYLTIGVPRLKWGWRKRTPTNIGVYKKQIIFLKKIFENLKSEIRGLKKKIRKFKSIRLKSEND